MNRHQQPISTINRKHIPGLGLVLISHGKSGAVTVLLSDDAGYNRHSLVVKDGGYITRVDEVECFRRTTHEAMAKAAGLDLSALRCDTFRPAHQLT